MQIMPLRSGSVEGGGVSILDLGFHHRLCPVICQAKAGGGVKWFPDLLVLVVRMSIAVVTLELTSFFTMLTKIGELQRQVLYLFLYFLEKRHTCHGFGAPLGCPSVLNLNSEVVRVLSEVN